MRTQQVVPVPFPERGTGARGPRNARSPQKSYRAGDRMTDDRAMSRVPRCCAHEPALVNLFDKLRAWRRAVENLVIAEEQAADGVIPPHELRTVEAKHDAARSAFLKADELVRKGTC